MLKVILRKMRASDVKHFLKWWRDDDLIALTSGDYAPMSDEKIVKSVMKMAQSKHDYHFMIVVNGRVIGHVTAAQRRGEWYEIQRVIGEKKYWSKGYGTMAMALLIKKMRRKGIAKFYVEIRPENVRSIRSAEKSGFLRARIIERPKNKNQLRVVRMELRTS